MAIAPRAMQQLLEKIGRCRRVCATGRQMPLKRL
jgi:hypothetical protein